MLNKIATNTDVINFCVQFCAENDVTLLYITEYGSHLYGTNTNSSDKDYKAIYLPNIKSLLTGDVTKFSAMSTGNDISKNTVNDIDIEFYSLQFWLNNVRRGETGALDILFSLFSNNTQLFYNKKLDGIKENYKSLFNATDASAFIKFAISQANRYSVKGDRLNAIKVLYDYIKDITVDDDGRLIDELSGIRNLIETQLPDNQYVQLRVDRGPNNVEQEQIIVLGKTHLCTISFNEFKERIYSSYKKYGRRAHIAASENGVDYKALSHALRSCIQMYELLMTEFIKFPLADANRILEIKQAKLTFDETNDIIDSEISAVDNILTQVKNGELECNIKYNKNVVDEIILNFYREEIF